MVLRWLVAAGLAACLGASSDPKDFVTAVESAHVTVAAGKPGAVRLKFRVSEGFHINSSEPHSAYLIPTKLKLSAPTDVGIGKITYPAGVDMALAFSPDEKLNVYSGDFTITANVSSVRTATPGHYKVHGELSYQACNDRACYPPKKLPVVFDVTVLKSRITAKTPLSSNSGQSPHVHR